MLGNHIRKYKGMEFLFPYNYGVFLIKVLTIIGTRPEIIRLSRVICLLDTHVDHIIVHTGQNYDYELNELFFSDLNIRCPDYFLDVDTSSLGRVIGDTISKVEPILLKENPDAVLILGDTNSSLAGIIAKRLQFPLYHMEAGNRSFDYNVPEEINRRIIDHISDFNLVYTEQARRNLIAEGFPSRRIILTGSPLYEVLHFYKKKIDSSMVLQKLELEKDNYFVVSIHRQENVDNPNNLKKIVNILNSLAETYNLPLIMSVHPRTRKRLEVLTDVTVNELILLHKPFSFTDYVNLQKNSLCVLSDSGTISEESAMMGYSAVSLREATERPEAIDAGSIILTGLDADIVLDSVSLSIPIKHNFSKMQIPWGYQINNTSSRVLRLILGTCKLSNKWNGIYSIRDKV
jgi:UDP-N-acetyl-L-fucosamine synthase